MKHGFQNKLPLLTRSRDGRNVLLEEHLYFIDRYGNELRTMSFMTSDGGSIPRLFWNIIAPFGRCWWSYILHDALFRGTCERWNPAAQSWCRYTPNEHKCNALLFEAMETQGVDRFEAWIVWIALNWFGWRAFKEDRRAAKSHL